MFLLPKKEFEVSFEGTPLEKYMDFFDLSGKLLVYFDLDNNPLLLKETDKVEREIRFWHNIASNRYRKNYLLLLSPLIWYDYRTASRTNTGLP